MLKKDQAWEHDADYIRYVKSGESAAVFVVRDVVQAVNTSCKWIDIVSMSCYEEEPDGKAFNWIMCELFPRKIQPQYVYDNPEYNRYITWFTAHQDIDQQRSGGYSGPKFLVLCRLINHNKGITVTLNLISITRNYKGSDGSVWEVAEAPDEQETFQASLKPDWEYRITFLKRLNDSQAAYITEHADEILRRIQAAGKADPEFFGLTSQINNGKGK